MNTGTSSQQWYPWGVPNSQHKFWLCTLCWIYWKKYGGLKRPGIYRDFLLTFILQYQGMLNPSCPCLYDGAGFVAVGERSLITRATTWCLSKNVSSTITVDLNLFLSDGLSGKSHGSLQPSYTCRVCGKVFNRAGLNVIFSFFDVNQCATSLQGRC